MAQFKVTIIRTVATEVCVDALNAREARKTIEDYGVLESASDMANHDEVTARIKSVSKVS